MFILFLLSLISILGFGLIFPLLPEVQLFFNFNDFQISIYGSIFAFTSMIGCIYFGMLSDNIGRKRVFILTLFMLSISYLTLGLIFYVHYNNVALGYIVRAFTGFFSGSLPVCFAAGSDLAQNNKEKIKYMGFMGAGFGVGFAFGPTFGSVLYHTTQSLYSPFFISSLVYFLGLVIVLIYFHETNINITKKQSLKDVIAILLSFSKKYKMLLAILLNTILSFSFTSLEVVLVLELAHKWGLSIVEIGICFTFFSILLTVCQLILPRFIFGYTAIIIGFICFSIFTLNFLFITSVTFLFCNLILAAVADGILFPNLSALMSFEGEDDQQGLVFGLGHGVASLGRFLGPAVLGFIYYYFDVSWVWIMLSVLSVLSSLVAYVFLYKKYTSS